MTKKWLAVFTAVIMILSLAACGEKEEETTTLSGMVVSVDGTTISLVEMSANSTGGMDFSGGQRPEMPEGMEGFQGFGDFNPEDFSGEMPEGGNFPQWGSGEMPGGGNFPQWGSGEMPEDMTIPENGEMPEDMTLPEGMTMPNFPGGNGGMRPGSGSFASDAETKTVDIGKAHISVEIDGGKASGSMSDIKAGSFVTITLNGKGEATYVLISSNFGFGGKRGSAT